MGQSEARRKRYMAIWRERRKVLEVKKGDCNYVEKQSKGDENQPLNVQLEVLRVYRSGLSIVRPCVLEGRGGTTE